MRASSPREENGGSGRRGDNDKLYPTIAAEQMDHEPSLLLRTLRAVKVQASSKHV